MRTLALINATVIFTALGTGCLLEEDDVDAASATADVTEVRRVLLCQQGLSDRTFEWDKGLFALCEKVEDAGFTLVHDGSYPAFGALDTYGAYQALFDTLDTNDDGVVDGDDERSLIHLVGFSWGGINITRIARELLLDDRIATSRAGVGAMVLFDPYQPLVSLEIPGNVVNTWVYRQTETTSGDCSSTVSFGLGFNGKEPVATSDIGFCTHYDLDELLGPTGHCQVPSRATNAAFVNLTKYREHEAWADRGVACGID